MLGRGKRVAVDLLLEDAVFLLQPIDGRLESLDAVRLASDVLQSLRLSRLVQV